MERIFMVLSFESCFFIMIFHSNKPAKAREKVNDISTTIICLQVCNHPELFERREARSPFLMDIGPYVLPSLILNNNIHSARGQISASDDKFGSKHHWLYNRLCIFNPSHVHKSLTRSTTTKNSHPNNFQSSTFSYLRFIETKIQ